MCRYYLNVRSCLGLPPVTRTQRMSFRPSRNTIHLNPSLSAKPSNSGAST